MDNDDAWDPTLGYMDFNSNENDDSSSVNGEESCMSITDESFLAFDWDNETALCIIND